MRIVPGLIFAAAIAVAAPAWAHPTLVSVTPAAGGTVTGSPTAIRMTFSEAPAVKFSGLKLIDAAGNTVRTGAPEISPTEKKQLVVPVTTSLKPGAYRVEWFAVAADTHRITGKFTFTVK